MKEDFSWITFDVSGLLPNDWQSQILDVSKTKSTQKIIKPPHVTSRESENIKQLTLRGVSASNVRKKLPWITELYHGKFLELAQLNRLEQVSAAKGERHTVVINVQMGNDMRYECHVDTNPIQGMLYVTSHPFGQGGELVVARKGGAYTLEDIEADPVCIYPQTGHLIFFDARFHAHYVRKLIDKDDVRVAVAMNYYVPSCPEPNRPIDLDDYLYGEPI